MGGRVGRGVEPRAVKRSKTRITTQGLQPRHFPLTRDPSRAYQLFLQSIIDKRVLGLHDIYFVGAGASNVHLSSRYNAINSC